MIRVEIEADRQDGPIVRVIRDRVSVTVYLMDETAVVTSDDGQYGTEVYGNWNNFKKETAAALSFERSDDWAGTDEQEREG